MFTILPAVINGNVKLLRPIRAFAVTVAIVYSKALSVVRLNSLRDKSHSQFLGRFHIVSRWFDSVCDGKLSTGDCRWLVLSLQAMRRFLRFANQRVHWLRVEWTVTDV